MKPLDSSSLRVFIAVAHRLSFSDAAQALHLTQPAVSKRIAELESTLGRPLFERFKRQVRLTPAGQELVPLAEDILDRLSNAQKMLNDMSGPVSGKLTLAFSHHVGLHRLPPYLKQFRNLHPQVKLDVEFVDSDTGYQRVMDGRVELSVITLKPTAPTEIVQTTLWRDPLAFVCSPEHSLHLHDDLSLELLAEHEAILPSSGTETREIVDDIFQKAAAKPLVSMDTNYLETIKTMVSIGLGWSVLPKTMTGGLELMHLPDIYLERNLGMISHRSRRPSRAAQAFSEILKPTQPVSTQTK